MSLNSEKWENSLLVKKKFYKIIYSSTSEAKFQNQFNLILTLFSELIFGLPELDSGLTIHKPCQPICLSGEEKRLRMAAERVLFCGHTLYFISLLNSSKPSHLSTFFA